MSSADEVLKIARSQIGVKESPKNSNKQKYGKEYRANGEPWCAMFVWWVFKHAGCPELFYGGKKSAYCPTIADYYIAKKQTVSKSSGKPGDIVLFDFNNNNSSDHIGIIEKKNSNGTYTTIEGNTGVGNNTNGGQVMRRTRYQSDISWICRPEYTEKSSGSIKMLKVKEYQRNLKYYYNYYKGEIDGVFGSKTKEAVKAFQKAKGLEIDGIYGTKTNYMLVTKVRNLQNLLNKNGCNLAITGVINDDTVRGIKYIQRKKGFNETGIADKTTVSFLNSTLKTTVNTKPTTSTSTTQNKTKYSKYLIYLNPGHGGNDPGAVRKGRGSVVARESDMNLRVCNSLNTYLKEMGFKTGMTRQSDKYMSLSDRANKANNAKADLYISVHFNAGGGDGLELIVHPSSRKGYKLATHLKDHITKETGQGFRRYIKRADADVRISNMPAVIIEGCFMDTSDFKLIETSEKRKKLAKAYANGIKSYIDSL